MKGGGVAMPGITARLAKGEQATAHGGLRFLERGLRLGPQLAKLSARHVYSSTVT